MRTNHHGGECCGVKHIYGMGSGPAASTYFANTTNLTSLQALILAMANWDEEVIGEVDEEEDDLLNNGRVKEVILTDNQMTNGWPEALAELGFKKVASFLNSNSDNICHVFYHHPALTLYGDHPQPARVTVREVEVPGPPVRAEVREILVEYFPNFRESGRGRPYSSALEVRDAHPLVRRIERRTVFSDGSITWEDI